MTICGRANSEDDYIRGQRRSRVTISGSAPEPWHAIDLAQVARTEADPTWQDAPGKPRQGCSRPPQPGVVPLLQPAIGVSFAECDQLVDELAREEQIAEQLAVDGAALGVDIATEQRDVAVAHEAGDARVVLFVGFGARRPISRRSHGAMKM